MSLTIEQLKGLGFKPSIRGRGGLSKTKKYDSLVLDLNGTDFLYTGYNPYKNIVNYKTIWKSFKDSEGNRITYQVVNLGDTGFGELQSYIKRSFQVLDNYKELIASPDDIKDAIPNPLVQDLLNITQDIPTIDG